MSLLGLVLTETSDSIYNDSVLTPWKPINFNYADSSYTFSTMNPAGIMVATRK